MSFEFLSAFHSVASAGVNRRRNFLRLSTSFGLLWMRFVEIGRFRCDIFYHPAAEAAPLLSRRGALETQLFLGYATSGDRARYNAPIARSPGVPLRSSTPIFPSLTSTFEAILVEGVVGLRKIHPISKCDLYHPAAEAATLLSSEGSFIDPDTLRLLHSP